MRLNVRVIPRAPREKIDGLRDGRVVIRVTAPPVDAAANDAVIALLARTLGVSRAAISIVSGVTSRNKTIDIAGMDDAAVRLKLSV